MLHGSERRAVAQAISQRILLEGRLSDLRRIVGIFEDLACDVDVEGLIRCCLDGDRSGEQVSHSLVVFDGLSVPTRNMLIANIDLIAQQIAKRDKFDLTQSGAEAAASLLQHSSPVNSRKYAVACSTILPKALNAKDKPASPIVVAAFPTVYESLHGKSDIFSMIGMKAFMDDGKRKNCAPELGPRIYGFCLASGGPCLNGGSCK